MIMNAMMDPKISQKVQLYQDFIDNNLKEDLRIVEGNLKENNEKLSDWYLLQKTVQDIRDGHPKGFKTRTDVGSGILCQVHVPDPSVVHMNVGEDIYLTMTLDEADKYCDMRVNILKRQVVHCQHQANHIKTHIKTVLLGIGELLNLCTR